MPKSPLLKVYGHLWPVDTQLCINLEEICREALPVPDSGTPPVFYQDGDLARISFEGIYFPLDDLLELIAKVQDKRMQGKLDLLDLENWRLVRHIVKDGSISCLRAPLNNVLDYSGH